MRTRGCIFDLDGTLANTLASIAGFVNDTLAARGFGTLPVEAFKTIVGNGADLILRRSLARVGASLPEEEFPALRREYDRRYEAAPLRDVTLYPGVKEVLEDLHARGFRLGVVSNKPDNVTREIVGSLFPGLLDQVHGAREGVPRKPDPTAVLAMAADFGLAPGEILYVGDSGVDMDTARNAGMPACGVLWGFREKEELTAHGADFLAPDAETLHQIAVNGGN